MHNTIRRHFPPCPEVVSEQAVHDAVRELAGRIWTDHPENETLVVVGVLKGALLFVADLVRHLPVPLEIEFVGARSYAGTEQGGVQLLDDVCELSLAGRHVLIADCVLDTGRTFAAVREAVKQQQPAHVACCALLSKQRERKVQVPVEYVGIPIPDVFVVGYGLDYRNRWRHLPYVARLLESEIEPQGDVL